MKLTGLKELEKKLLSLTKKDGQRAIRNACMQAAKPIEAKAREFAQRSSKSGALALAIGRRFSVETKGSDVGKRFKVEVGAIVRNKTAVSLHNLAYGRKVRGIVYGHLIERGYTKPSGKPVQARPFLLPALRAARTEAVKQFSAALARSIKRITARNARRA